MQLTRRTLLAGAGSVAALGVVGGGVVGYGLFADGSFVSWVHHVLRSHLPGVKLAAQEIDQFAKDLMTVRPPYRKIKAATIANGYVYSTAESLGLESGAVENYQRQIVTLFLLNSDFFQLEDPLTEEVTYFGIMDPICSVANPFAQLLTA